MWHYSNFTVVHLKAILQQADNSDCIVNIISMIFHCFHECGKPWKSMPSTEHRIFSPVDGCFNQNPGKPCFRCAAHETYRIAVRIEMRVFPITRKITMNTLNTASSGTLENGFLTWFTWKQAGSTPVSFEGGVISATSMAGSDWYSEQHSYTGLTSWRQQRDGYRRPVTTALPFWKQHLR